MDQKKTLRKVPISYLWEGLVLSDDLYNYNGKVLLVPQKKVLTKGRLERLIKFESANKYITTYDTTYQIILERHNGPLEERQIIVEEESGYSSLKNSVADIFHRTKDDGMVPFEEVSRTAGKFEKRFQSVEMQSIFSCIEMPRPMDELLLRHCMNVAMLNGLMGEWMSLPKEDVQMLVMAGILHDVGKTGISSEILNAPRKLMEDEFEEIKKHPLYSYKLLGSEFSEKIKTAVLYHHEKIDGSGYPEGLKGDEIPFFAKIISITDIYDAMVTKRCYKDEQMVFQVLSDFYEAKFQGIDEELTYIFLKNMRKTLMGRKVIMSDGTQGTVRYIPPNDFANPIVQTDSKISQTDEEWSCKILL